jgi:3-phenylpropionate/trans-cinnamate dioxygenase ferredoxin reductase component
MGIEYSGYVAKGNDDQVVFRGDLAKGECLAFWTRAIPRRLATRRTGAGRHERQRWNVTDTIAALVRSGIQVNKAGWSTPACP